MSHLIEITGLAKDGGPLSKRISYRDGKVTSNGSSCVMSSGQAGRFRLGCLTEFASLIGSLNSNEAIALGRLTSDLPERVRVLTKKQLDHLGTAATPDMIARVGGFISYVPGQPALALIDIDAKGMPKAVADQIGAAGDYWQAMVNVLPGLANAARVTRRSTSTGIYHTETGEKFPGSNGAHIFVLVQDGGDVERFLRTFHDRCWLAGLGWYIVGAAGQLLERAICDRSVYAPERLVFEGPPVMVAPLAQDQSQRAPVVTEGEALDTRAICPPLTIAERARLKELQAKAAHRIAPDSNKARSEFLSGQSEKIAKRTGMAPERARRIVEQQTGGVLLPDVALAWDDPDLAGATVADVLADPDRFDGATLADPLEGPDYGVCKAKVMRRADGSPWIHSFAHGRTVYDLRYDGAAIRAALAGVSDDKAAALLAKMMRAAILDQSEAEEIRNEVAKRAGVGKRTIDKQIKAAQAEQANQRAKEERQRQAAERLDTRPQIPAPEIDAPWLPQMEVLNDVLGASTDTEPPMRDIDGAIAQVRVRRVPNMHALSAEGANDGDTDETRLPPPELPLLSRLGEIHLSEMIERHIDYIDGGGRSVHLAAPFVRHFHTRDDDVLPTVAAISTLPLMLPDGALLSKRGLDRKRGIVFRVPPELCSILPRAQDCTPSAVAEAMRFLTDDWLADVASDYTGKCTLIAAALTVIERALLPERPAFFVNAGRRGSGKTTVLIMLLAAVTGARPSAAAWSTNEEERRKALLSYLMEAIPAIVWDNIPRGLQISCPHLEKACTSSFYSDRRLGVSELVSVAASSIHFFTGNNIGPKGDLASRSLQVRLEVDRADPENREFKHTDPIGWTEANRGRILAALYTIMLGNPVLKPGSNKAPETRFKAWWRLVGSAVEHAAEQHAVAVANLAMDPTGAVKINFRDMFLQQEEGDEDSAGLADVLAAIAAKWPKAQTFQAADLARLLNDTSDYKTEDDRERTSILREFLFPKVPANQDVSAKSVGRMIKAHVGNPVPCGGRALTLKAIQNTHPKTTAYFVKGG